MNTNDNVRRILVTGASGLLGLNFCYFFHQKYQVIGIENHTHLSGTPFQVIHRNLLEENPDLLISETNPDIILHCAAMADIDKCEKSPAEAKIINSDYPGKLAGAAKKRNIKFIHISTDAVFDGEDCGKDGYHEDDRKNPISRYAETKLLGEENVLDNNSDALIARVNFYGWSTSGKRSLVEFFYNNLSLGNQVKGFKDVFFNTLYVRELAIILDEMIGLDAKGVFHVFSSEHQSKYAFGVSVAKQFGFDPELVQPVSWKDGGLTAKRSPNLIMNTDKLQNLLGHTLPNQKDSINMFHHDTCNDLRQIIRSFVSQSE